MKRLRYSLLSFALLLVPTLANAELIKTFTPTDGDLSIRYLGSIFGVVGTVLSGTGTQILGKMFAVYNAGALSLGGIIVMYVLLSSTLNTAQDGEIMGKRWSSIWIPVRTALGVGLLLPQTTGYSFIQVFVMWVVVQGVGLGDHIWNAALTYLSKGGVIISKSYNPSINAKSNQATAAGNLLKNQVCVSMLQQYLQQARNTAITNGSANIPPPVPPLANSFDPMTAANLDKPKEDSTVQIPTVSSDSPYAALNGICGSATWQGVNGKEISKRLKLARASGLQQMILDFQGPARQVALNYMKPPGSSTKYNLGHCDKNKKTCNQDNWNNGEPSVLAGQLLQHTNAAYEGILLPVMRSLFDEDAVKNLLPGVSMDDFYGWMSGSDGAKSKGWMLAGAWYFDLTQANDNVRRISDRNVPTIAITPANNVNSFCAEKNGITRYLSVNQCRRIYYLASYDKRKPYTKSGINNDNILQNYINSALKYKLPYTEGDGGGSNNNTPAHIAGTVARFLPLVGPMVALGEDLKTLQKADGSKNQNPLVLVSSVGNDLLNIITQIWLVTGITAFAVAMSLGTLPCLNLSSGVLALINWLAPFMAAILTLMFAAGVMLAYYVPLIPFIIFSFAAIGWLIGVIEAIVAAPIVALGVIHPEGHELVGKSAQAIMILTNVFLRPAMMIIGLIAGIGVSYIGIWLLNSGFAHASAGITVTGTGGIWKPAAMSIIYAALCVAMLQKSFSLIHIIPDKVLRWLSGGFQESLGAESANEAQSTTRGALGQAGSQAGNTLTSSTSGAMKGMVGDDKNDPSLKVGGRNGGAGQSGVLHQGGDAPGMNPANGGGGDGASGNGGNDGNGSG